MQPSQARAARALLDMSQPKLAEAAGVGLSTVVDFERSRRVVSDDAIGKIQVALEMAGVIFVEENDEGPGVRLRKQAAQSETADDQLSIEYEKNSGECFVTCSGVRKFLGLFETLELAQTAADEYQREIDRHKLKEASPHS